MLAKYKSIIYKDKNHERTVINNCINYIQKNHPNYTKEEMYDLIEKNRDDMVSWDFIEELLMTEGQMLFAISVERFGNKLWARDKLPKNCGELCPFGDMCDKYLVKIDGECFCYGQMLHKHKINMKLLQKIAKEKQVKIIKPNGETFIDLSLQNYDEQLLSYYLFEYEYYIMWFGDNNHNKFKVNGNNIIKKL